MPLMGVGPCADKSVTFLRLHSLPFFGGCAVAVLSNKKRAKLPKKVFAGPDRSFPLPDKKHARAALMLAPLSRRKGNLTAEQERRIVAKAKAMLHARTGVKRGKS